MTTTLRTILTFIATLLGVAGSTSLVRVDGSEQLPSFRGVLTDVVSDEGTSNRYFAPVFQRHSPWYIDVQDSFGREGLLLDGVADTWRNGFVPPFANVPRGPLTGSAAELAGRWMGHTLFETRNGKVGRVESDKVAVACIPWRVTQDLGDDYLLSMTAFVAQGETVRLGYFGDVATFGTAEGLSGQLGQLVLDVSRGEGDDAEQIVWSVAWDMNGNRQTFTSTTTAPVDEELTMQLGWLDDNKTNNDLFDAWIVTSEGPDHLLAGNMFTAIEVFGAGFQMSGEGSYIRELIAAVPEPNTGVMLTLGSLLAFRRRRSVA